MRHVETRTSSELLINEVLMSAYRFAIEGLPVCKGTPYICTEGAEYLHRNSVSDYDQRTLICRFSRTGGRRKNRPSSIPRVLSREMASIVWAL
jgi:hypothetical protein